MEFFDISAKICLIVTGRNEVVAKVMFLLVSVILSTGHTAYDQWAAGTHPTGMHSWLIQVFRENFSARFLRDLHFKG